MDEKTRPGVLDDYDTPAKRVAAWNHYREVNLDFIPDLRSAKLESTDLSGINLSRALLLHTDLTHANLAEADLTDARLTDANLSNADLAGAVLTRAKLNFASLNFTNLTHANLTHADLTRANLAGADLSRTDLSHALLSLADLSHTDLTNATFREVECRHSVFANVDLTQPRALDKIQHTGPSTIGTDTFECSKGNISEDFLRGCGLAPWQVLSVRLYDPSLSPADIAEIQQQIFDERTKGYFLNGVFISYSRNNEMFVEHLYEQLKDAGANVWLDSLHAIAGPLEKQVERAIRLNDVVLIVLSESSINSDWVEAELEWARNKEAQTGRNIICPIALDDSWKSKVAGSVLWRKVKDKNILDFSGWETPAFDDQFRKLLDGMKVWYGPNAHA